MTTTEDSRAEWDDWTGEELAFVRSWARETRRRAAWRNKLQATRDLIDWLIENPDIEPPYGLVTSHMFWIREDTDARAELARIAWIMGSCEKRAIGEDYYGIVKTFEVHGDKIELQVMADRAKTCTAKVVGTKTVTRHKQIKPAEYADVTEEVDVIEWDCGPLLPAKED